MMNDALAINDLKKTYKNGVEALKGISFSVKEGDFFALLGPNGAGKSTTISIITSLIKKTSGTVSIFGYDVDHDIEMAKSFVGVVPQEFNFSIFEKVENILLTQAAYYGIPKKVAKQRSEFYLKKFDLWGKRHQPARSLSGGMKRRLMIARALMHNPRLLILDEPTAGVDIEIRRAMWDFLLEINQQGTTIILTTHYLEEAEQLCRNIAIINHGIIARNTSMNLLLRELDREYFVVDLAKARPVIASTPDFEIYPKDELTWEVSFSRNKTMNELFQFFSEHGVQVASLRNKSNRLEKLFLDLTGK
jgi:ABC-2 type transport system ATP-binding protein